MRAQPKPKTKAGYRFDQQAKKRAAENATKAKKYNAEHELNGECKEDGECAGFCGGCGS